MKKFITDILTGIDNQTIDIGRLLWALGVLVFLGISIGALVKGQPWEPEQYGIGLGAVLAGGGAGIGFKKGTEPTQKSPSAQ